MDITIIEEIKKHLRDDNHTITVHYSGASVTTKLYHDIPFQIGCGYDEDGKYWDGLV